MHVNLYFSQPKHSLYEMVTYTAKMTDSDIQKKIIQFIQSLSLEQSTDTLCAAGVMWNKRMDVIAQNNNPTTFK